MTNGEVDHGLPGTRGPFGEPNDLVDQPANPVAQGIDRRKPELGFQFGETGFRRLGIQT